MNDLYDADYFLRGQTSGKSLYLDYRWLPGLTIPMAKRIVEHIGMGVTDRILDFGCARGYLVRALVELGFDKALGYDLSRWALTHSDESVRRRLHNKIEGPFDWIISKDVLEHLAPLELKETLNRLLPQTERGMFVVVPLSHEPDSPYVVPEYEKDITHHIRWPLWKWSQAIQEVFGVGWSVCSQYRLEGVKDNYAQFEQGNGFITVRKITSPLP